MKNYMLLLIILIVVSFVPMFLFSSDKNEDIEEFRGRRGRRGRRGHRRRRYPMRRWWGHNWGYTYPPTFIWYSPWQWFRGLCKTGCANIGRGQWGCQYPGSNPDDCVFASDCLGCNY
jgi:hypothetical protein